MISATGAYISVKNLKKKHGDLAVLCGIDLEVTPGELTVLIGPSGCGKSTLLRCLNGLETLDSGSIVINGVALERSEDSKSIMKDFDKKARAIRENVGMVFQSFNLFPHLTLLENITKAPVVVKKMNVDLAHSQAKELLIKVGLERHADHYPCQLSGGQQQRAAIARALAMSPKAILYDEPTSALDPDLVHEVLQVMRTLDDEGMTQIVVTHEMRFARDVADHIVHMQEGRIVEMGTPEQIFSSPKDERTRRFLRNFL
ncbi:amino acid ABC transporter ATP-binding protein [Fluviispira multicolorata]|uniref:ATP-binding cassette domain-containing protein n=1 Tax=Fluviispira multicolorata TaxID=2654512 RepID=A0A833JG80_9BACT|nr:ATP-binding cassette domain-containing protein [Fluviispira multicolorata]